MGHKAEYSKDELGRVGVVSRSGAMAEIVEIPTIEAFIKGQGDGSRLVCGALAQLPGYCHTVFGMGVPHDPIIQWSKTVGCHQVTTPTGFFRQAPAVFSYKKYFKYLAVGAPPEIVGELIHKINPTLVYDRDQEAEQLQQSNCLLVWDKFIHSDLTKRAAQTMPVVAWWNGHEDASVTLYLVAPEDIDRPDRCIEININQPDWAVLLSEDIAHYLEV